MSEPTPAAGAPAPEEPGERLPYRKALPVLAGALAGLVLRLLFWGKPGGPYSAMLGAFIFGSPILVGAVTVYVAERIERRTWRYYFFAPALATLYYVCGALLIMIEGWICAILILPLFALTGGLAGLAMGVVCRVSRWPKRAVVGSVALFPLITGAFGHVGALEPRYRVQEREVFVAASPAAVWRQLVDVRDIRPDEVDSAWMYRIGVPLPVAGVADQRDGRHLRRVTMGKGIHFEQEAIEWREQEAVTWEYRFSPDSFPAHALDDHVRIGGHYFDLGPTRYTVSAVPGGTRLGIRMSYRVSTEFNWYAAPLADWLVGDFSEVILGFYAARAERAQPGASS